MKLTKTKLTQIIKEELQTVLNESRLMTGSDPMEHLNNLLAAAKKIREMPYATLDALKNKLAEEMEEDEYESAMGLLQKLENDPFYADADDDGRGGGEDEVLDDAEFSRLKKEGDLALRSWLGFMVKQALRVDSDLQVIANLWDMLRDKPGDVAAAAEAVEVLNIPSAKGAATFHGRRMKVGTEYPSGKKLIKLVTAYNNQSAKRRAARPRPPAPKGGGPRNRPYGRST